jgi:hypothetical protein
MEYGKLIRDALKKGNFKSRYALSKALGYKQVSVLYRVEKGEAGMSSDRLMKLLQLAGKLVVMLTIGGALLHPATDAQAGTDRSMSMYYVK